MSSRAFHHSIPTRCFKCLPGQQANLDSMDFAPMIVPPPTATVPLPLHHSVDRHAVKSIQRRPSRIRRLHARRDAFVALNEIWERWDRQQRTASSLRGTSSFCAAVQSGNCRPLAHAVDGQAGVCAEGIGTPHQGWECGSRTMTKLFPHCEQSVVDSITHPSPASTTGSAAFRRDGTMIDLATQHRLDTCQSTLMPRKLSPTTQLV
jgi:hypothetical protein